MGRMQKLIELLKGKSVCIVGGSTTVNEELYYCSDIDLYVRINWHWRQQGGPVDALYIKYWDKKPLPKELKWVGAESTYPPYTLYWSSKDRKTLRNIIYSYIPSRYYVGKTEKEFIALLDYLDSTTPSTGLLAICDLLRYPIRNLYITGFDFYEDPKNVHVRHHLHHDWYKQYRWLQEKYYEDKRIIPDKNLHRILTIPQMFIDNK